MSLPAPLTPEDADQREAKWMPFHGGLLFKSEAWMRASPGVRGVMVRMLWEAWANRPAASLPGDRATLMELAGIADAGVWDRVSGQVLAGFVLCSDGRWHHAGLARLVRSYRAGNRSHDIPTTVSPRDFCETPGQAKIVAAAVTEQARPDAGAAIAATEVRSAFDEWNAMAKRVGLPVAKAYSDVRARRLRRRLAEAGGLDGWRAALELVEGSTLLRGERAGSEHEGWTASLDFLLQPSTFARLMEGNYNDRPAPAHARQAPAGRATQQFARLLARRGVDVPIATKGI